ncbi:MAG: shikimate dehydrogenase [Cephaloticoccus sp.]|nr:shikimate dehydrogenase [Cephaloticoccus sp.]MCF7760134.1 shikimate dehydrogenase [Cephaloticoccus sp.]
MLTLHELEAWSFPGTALAVLGHPITHSLSPLMHNSALANLALTEPAYGDWRYFRFDVPPADLPQALATLYVRGFRGINLTVPHKILALNEVTLIDPAALPVGAINTLRHTQEGWMGFNTDGYGLATAVQESLGLKIRDRPVVLLGAGGAARGAAVECLQRHCASLWIANRTAETLAALLADLRPIAHGIPLHGFAPGHVPADLPADALVINATSSGMRADDAPPANLSDLPRPAGVFDMIYNPPLTPLLQAARNLHLPQANGLAMLVHQGAKALEIWSGVAAARTAPMMAAALQSTN